MYQSKLTIPFLALISVNIFYFLQDEIYNSSSSIESWDYIVNFYEESLPENGIMQARAIPRRFNTSLISLRTKQRICQLSAIDYCCLNMKLPKECDVDDLSIFCSLESNERGDFQIQPWFHPHQFGVEGKPAFSN